MKKIENQYRHHHSYLQIFCCFMYEHQRIKFSEI
jgi:hypothetical protein